MSRPNTSNTCVTTTAMPRPELIGPTYKSFQENMPWLNFKEMTLFLSVDRFPDTQGVEEIEKVIEIASSFFGNVICRNRLMEMQNIPNFPAAVQWCFSNANSEFTLHLEDDWLLLAKIPEEVVYSFEMQNIIQIGFRAWKLSTPRFVLSPSLIRTSFCNLVANQMNKFKNPETQIRGLNPHKVEESFLYWPLEEDKVILQDTGRGWMKNTHFSRGDDEFTKWNVNYNPISREREQRIRDQNAEIDRSKL